MANYGNDGRRDDWRDARRSEPPRDNRGWDRPRDDRAQHPQDGWADDAPRGYGAGQDETGWASGADRWSRQDQQRELAARSYADQRRGAPESYGDRGYPPANSGSGYSARDTISNRTDRGDAQRGGRSQGYDQYAGMTSEPQYGAPPRNAPQRGRPATNYNQRDDERGFWDRATDKVSSWFGDEDAERRREQDRMHTGRGPRNYTRSDERIHEDVCDRLTVDPRIDASDIEVVVKDREVTLNGHVERREDKRRAEDCAENVAGVLHVQNNLRVRPDDKSIGVMGAGVATSNPDTPAVGSVSEGAGLRRTPGVGAGMTPTMPSKTGSQSE